jgi:hypothetical protein
MHEGTEETPQRTPHDHRGVVATNRECEFENGSHGLILLQPAWASYEKVKKKMGMWNQTLRTFIWRHIT